MTCDALLKNLRTHRAIGGRQTKTKISLNLVVVFYC